MRLPLFALGFGVLSLGCSGFVDSEPFAIHAGLPSAPVIGSKPVALATSVVTRGGTALPDKVALIQWSSSPPGIADVSAGSMHCTASGDATVQATLGDIHDSLLVHCRIVGRVSLPEVGDLLVGEPGAKFVPVAWDEKNKELSDVPIDVKVSDDSVASYRDGALQAGQVGRTSVQATAGDVQAKADVTVIERMLTDNVDIPDGHMESRTLTRGNYRVEIQVRDTDGTNYGVTVSSTGGGCPERAEATNQVFECHVSGTSSFVVTNPTGWGMGPAELGNITIYKIP